MEALTWLFVIGALLALGLIAFALTRGPRGDGPPPGRARNAFERFWDTPEHSEAWDEEAERGHGRGGG